MIDVAVEADVFFNKAQKEVHRGWFGGLSWRVDRLRDLTIMLMAARAEN